MTKKEMADYFKWLAKKYDDEIYAGDVNEALKAFGKREAYLQAAYVLETELEGL